MKHFMIQPITIAESCYERSFNAAPVAIHFVASTPVFLGRNYGGFLINIQYAELVAEGSALVESRRNEQSKPLREILGA